MRHKYLRIESKKKEFFDIKFSQLRLVMNFATQIFAITHSTTKCATWMQIHIIFFNVADINLLSPVEATIISLTTAMLMCVFCMTLQPVSRNMNENWGLGEFQLENRSMLLCKRACRNFPPYALFVIFE